MPLRDYSFLFSLFLSRFADQILLFLVPLVVFQVTGSVSLSGYAFFLEALPRYLAFPISGILCDSFSSYKLLRLSQMMRSLFCVFALIGFWLVDSVAWLVALSAIVGVFTTQGLMSREVILIQAFNNQRFEKVISYTQIADQLGMVLAPLVAALLLSIFNWQLIVLLVAILFVSADILIGYWWSLAKPTLQPPTPWNNEWVTSFLAAGRMIWQLPVLKSLILLAVGVNLVVGITLATAPAIVTGLQQQSESYYGFVQAVGAVATVIILLITAHLRMSLIWLGGMGYVFIAIGGVLTSLGHLSDLYLIGFVLVIGFDKMFSVFLRSARKKVIPIKDFGKTTGLIVLLNNVSQPIAGLVVGLLAGSMDVRIIIFLVAMGMLVIGACSVLYLRQTLFISLRK